MALLAAPAAGQEAAPRKVDLELCLAVDGSGSIQEDEFAFQRQAYAQAVSHPDAVGIITAGFERSVAVALMAWGGPDSLKPILECPLHPDHPDAPGLPQALPPTPPP